MGDAWEQANQAQQAFFRATDGIPEEEWRCGALGAIGASAPLKRSAKDRWAISGAQRPPTFILLGVCHRLNRLSAR